MKPEAELDIPRKERRWRVTVTDKRGKYQNIRCPELTYIHTADREDST
jgi:hypothetical protein